MYYGWLMKDQHIIYNQNHYKGSYHLTNVSLVGGKSWSMDWQSTMINFLAGIWQTVWNFLVNKLWKRNDTYKVKYESKKKPYSQIFYTVLQLAAARKSLKSFLYHIVNWLENFKWFENFCCAFHPIYKMTHQHWAKSVCIRSYCGSYSPAFRLHMEIYGVSLLIQSKCGKIRTRITTNTGTFYAMQD